MCLICYENNNSNVYSKQFVSLLPFLKQKNILLLIMIHHEYIQSSILHDFILYIQNMLLYPSTAKNIKIMCITIRIFVLIWVHWALLNIFSSFITLVISDTIKYNLWTEYIMYY